MEASLPELWQKPVFQELVESLKALELKPLVWGVNVSTPEQLMQHENLKEQDRREISRFLSSLISSNLTWIEDEDEREVIWNTASKRLAERCGRTGKLLPDPHPTNLAHVLTMMLQLWARLHEHSHSLWSANASFVTV
jgi:hypothetical protein